LRETTEEKEKEGGRKDGREGGRTRTYLRGSGSGLDRLLGLLGGGSTGLVRQLVVALLLGELAVGHAGAEGLEDQMGLEANLEGGGGGSEGTEGRGGWRLEKGGREGTTGGREGKEGGRGRKERTLLSNIFLILGRDMPLRSLSARMNSLISVR